jgi:Ca2+-transporting ATPase
VIFAIVRLKGVLSYEQEAKAENAVAALARMTAVTYSLRRGGQTT